MEDNRFVYYLRGSESIKELSFKVGYSKSQLAQLKKENAKSEKKYGTPLWTIYETKEEIEAFFKEINRPSRL